MSTNDEARPRQAPSAKDFLGLFDALQALPEMQRKTVLLRYWLSLSVEETAGELGISAATGKGHSSRGLAALQRVLAAHGV